jgi:hypothetical protein
MFSLNYFLSLLAVTASVATAMATLLIAYRSRRESRFDDRLHRAELSALRESLEHKIYQLNDQLVATDARWREMNHLVIASQSRLRETDVGAAAVQPDRFLRSFQISPESDAVEPDLVFMLTPFSEEHRKAYEVVKSACIEIGLRCVRGDEEFIRGELLPHVVRLITRARIVIANIDGRNPNVFYELGIAHALGKNTILIARQSGEIPIDLRTNKILIYDAEPALRVLVQRELARSLAANFAI